MRGESFRGMLYRCLVVFNLEVADPEGLAGMVHELSAIFRH